MEEVQLFEGTIVAAFKIRCNEEVGEREGGKEGGREGEREREGTSGHNCFKVTYRYWVQLDLTTARVLISHQLKRSKLNSTPLTVEPRNATCFA